MGLRYRKSIKLGGGFRINISKSGIGYSYGVPGYRVTHTANGRKRTTASIPGTGISYVSESSGKKKKAENSDSIPVENVAAIPSVDIEKLQPVEYQEIIKKLQKILKLNRISTWMCFCLIFYISPTLFPIGVLGVILKLCVHLFGHIDLEYCFDESVSSQNAKNRLTAWNNLRKCRRIWYVTKTADTQSSRNSGGATGAFSRELTYIQNKLPFYIKSNITIPVIPMPKRNEMLLILPDYIMIIQKNKIGVVSHSDVKYDIYATGEVCKEAPANDSKFVKTVWLYANKDGSPDKRHKDNVQLPVYEIGRLNLFSASGLDIKLMLSNTAVLENFESEIKAIEATR